MTVDKGIPIKNIYYMLSYAFRILKRKEYKRVMGEKFDKINNLFAAILEKGISYQLRQGLYREYVPVQDDLPVLRGKLNINSTVRLQVQRKQKLSCEFDEFSEDNLYNQILKATIHRLIRAEDVDDERRKSLRKLNAFFNNVSLIKADHIAWSRLIYQRNNRNYELLLNICYFVLNGMLQTTDNGRYKLISFTDKDMERLYERFILEYYRQHHPELKPAAAHIEWNLTEDNRTMIRFLPGMQTDVTLRNGDKTLIIDAKYYAKPKIKRYTKETLISANLYQIFAYVKNMDKDNTGNVSGLLLYAGTEDNVFPEGEPFVICGNKIEAKTLNLNCDFTEISRQLDNIAAGFNQEWENA